MRGRELVERGIERQELVVVAGKRDLHVLHFHPPLAAAVAGGAFAPGAINQNPPHRLGGRSKKMRTVREVGHIAAHESKPRLVHQRSGLQGVARGFLRHPAGRQPAQFFVNQRQQLIGGFGIAVSIAVRRSVASLITGPDILP